MRFLQFPREWGKDPERAFSWIQRSEMAHDGGKFGKAPVRLLVFKYRNFSFGRENNSLGISPDKKLLYSPKYSRFLHNLTSEGIVPQSKLVPKLSSNSCFEKIWAGIDPWRPLSLRRIVLSRLQFPSSWGIPPVKLLMLRSRESKCLWLQTWDMELAKIPDSP